MNAFQLTHKDFNVQIKNDFSLLNLDCYWRTKPKSLKMIIKLIFPPFLC